jgi:transcriptional regulator with XRE-family HTH domain
LDAKWLGFRIRQARERRGLSQEELASAVTKDQRAISEYENGRRKLAVTDLPVFAAVLGVPLMYFFEEEAEMFQDDDLLLTYFHQLPSSEARQAALDILRIFSATIRHH